VPADSDEPEVWGRWKRGLGVTPEWKNPDWSSWGVGGSRTRLSMVARIERGGAAVRGQRGCRGRSWKGRRGAPARGGARG
jgi:hypothetical protein